MTGHLLRSPQLVAQLVGGCEYKPWQHTGSLLPGEMPPPRFYAEGRCSQGPLQLRTQRLVALKREKFLSQQTTDTTPPLFAAHRLAYDGEDASEHQSGSHQRHFDVPGHPPARAAVDARR